MAIGPILGDESLLPRKHFDNTPMGLAHEKTVATATHWAPKTLRDLIDRKSELYRNASARVEEVAHGGEAVEMQPTAVAPVDCQCEELRRSERQARDMLTQQLYQVEDLTNQLQHKNEMLRISQTEVSNWKDKAAEMERQLAQLQTSIHDKDRAYDQLSQLVAQRSSELSCMENKVSSLQSANELLNEQTRKAVEERDKVQKDYLQVVFELGKIKKQLNATAKETVSIAEKDLLLREIDQLRREKEKLVEKLRDAESRKVSLMQSSTVVESQRVKELMARVSDLEDQLQRQKALIRAGGGSSSLASSALPPPAPLAPSNLLGLNSDNAAIRKASAWNGAALYPSTDQAPANVMNAWEEPMKPLAQVPSLLHSVSRTDNKTMTLKDTALCAPFATEKQSLLQDALQKRDLEQKLLRLHVDKEQVESKLAKVEQSGLKTMNARTEKAWLESRLRDLTQEISRLKMSLR
ncbi:hypothetical protein PINS_up009214 [Pythium insidiosum]|nr:hypothetical protein PINS_up009214 [Pythium insidiosum]